MDPSIAPEHVRGAGEENAEGRCWQSCKKRPRRMAAPNEIEQYSQSTKAMKTFLKTVAGFNLATLVHLIHAKCGLFIRSCSCALSAARFPDPTADIGIPVIQLGKIIGARKPAVHLQVKRDEEGVLPSDQALVLAAILVAENPTSILEIGTFVGSTTRLIAENCPHAVVHTVDLPLDFTVASAKESPLPKDDFQLISRRVVGREFSGQPCQSRIVQHLADTAEWDFSEAGSPTFFFIDGSHTYEYCKNDSEKCFELCRGNGVFLWHDCDWNHPGVIRCLMEWRSMGRDVRRIAGTPLAYFKG